MTDLRQSPQYAKYIKSIGWKVEQAKGYYIFIRKIPLTPFSIIKIQRPERIPFEKIDQLAKKYRALAVYLEPSIINHQSLTIKHDYHLSKSPFLPTKTIHLDLTPSGEKILAQMEKDARYGIRKAKKEALQLIKVKDLVKFHQTWRKSVSWQRWVPSLKSLQSLRKAFGKQAIFLTASHFNQLNHQSEPIAGTIILLVNKTAYYYYAFTSQEGRKKYAQYLLVWEAIKLAKKKGCKIFDFEGIEDPRYKDTKKWAGFSHFKKSFGGKEVIFPGAFIKFSSPILKLLFRSL